MNARILVLHDQETRRKQLRDALQPMHRTTAAGSVTEAITLLKSAEFTVLQSPPFDLIISAVHLDCPDHLCVFDLLKWTRKIPLLSNVPFLLVDLEPSRCAKQCIEGVRGASCSLGASGYLIVDRFEPKQFLCEIEHYLPPELRTSDCLDGDLPIFDAGIDASGLGRSQSA